MKIRNLLYCVAFMALSININAQKFGHLNSGNLLEKIPEVKSADEQLKTYQEGLMSKGQTMVEAFETKYKAYAAEAQGGTLSRLEMQTKEQALQKDQQEIQEYEKKIQIDVMKKREELLQPILMKVDKAIKEVGKENGYTFIFDTSLGAMLYAPDTEDVEPLVLSKLNL